MHAALVDAQRSPKVVAQRRFRFVGRERDTFGHDERQGPTPPTRDHFSSMSIAKLLAEFVVGARVEDVRVTLDLIHVPVDDHIVNYLMNLDE